jgi:hypothetical protein
MARKRYKPEEIVAKLRQVDAASKLRLPLQPLRPHNARTRARGALSWLTRDVWSPFGGQHDLHDLARLADDLVAALRPSFPTCPPLGAGTRPFQQVT